MKTLLQLRIALLLFIPFFRVGAQARAMWTREHARAWADSTGWLVGSNFAPSNAINQLEMWQAATFDPWTIDRELGGPNPSASTPCEYSCTISSGSRTRLDFSIEWISS